MGRKNNNFKPWYVLIVCCGLAASSIGVSINSSGVFYTPVAESLGIMRGTFAMHMTIFSIVTAITSLIIPKLMDKFSYKLILTLGVAAAVLSTGLMSYAKSAPIFYLLGGIRGFSTAMFSIVPLTMIINGWFKKNHGLATSMVLGFSGIAGAIFSPLLSRVIESYGWQTGYFVKAALILVLCLPAVIYKFEVSAEDEGMKPYGYDGNRVTERSVKSDVKLSFMTTCFVCFFIFAFICNTITGITQHLPGFAESIGYGSSIGAVLISAGMLGNVIFKLVIGFVSDRIGEVKASIMMLLVNVTGTVLLMTAGSSFMLIAGAFLFGAIYSVCAVGMPLLTKYLFGTDNYSKVFPKISFASNFGAAFALSLVGYIYDFTSSYSYAFIVGAAINITCLALILIIVKQHETNAIPLKEVQVTENQANG